MSPRIFSEWLWYLIAIYAGSSWSPVRCSSVRQPPNSPSTIEAQAKFFQDFFSVQLSPYKIEFGHVCEDPNTWEQRYEKKDFKNHRDMGKVRWGDKKGGYGEHYWDLNHAGHNNDHDDSYSGRNHDDASYHDNNNSYHDDDNDPYDEPSENSPSYGVEEYDPEKSSYEDNGRAKRAHPKVKVERKADDERVERQRKRKNTEQQTSASQQIDDKNKPEHKSNEDVQENENKEDVQENENKEKKQVVLVLNHRDKDADKQIKEQQNQFVPKRQHSNQHSNHFVPYENGAGVREHQHPEAAVAASVPRLFLEPSTGHVVDRATGQAYVLQPIRNRYLESLWS